MVARLAASGANMLREPCAAEEAVLGWRRSSARGIHEICRGLPSLALAPAEAELSDLGADPTSCRGQISVLLPSGMGAWEYRTGQ